MFGFPNPLIGIAAFSVVVVTGVLAVAKIELPRWYWVGLMAGTGLGALFVHWLIFQSLYKIGALCPYCMVVWSVTILSFVVASTIAILITAPNPVARVLYMAMVDCRVVVHRSRLMILVRFWNYWSTPHLVGFACDLRSYANRGEIAVRAFRAAYEMGIGTVAVYPMRIARCIG